jgi:hypothetical protein
MCSFLDRSCIIIPYHTSGSKRQWRVLCLQVVAFESPNITEEAALSYYHFEFDVLGSLPQQFYIYAVNTLPSNTSKSYFPGSFHSGPRSRLLALEVEVPMTGFIDIPFHVLYIPHDVLLGYIMSHPSDTDTVVVPWEAWGLGNTHIITLPDPPDRFLGSKIVCGMHAMTEPPMIISKGDQKMLRIMDCHPRRVVRNSHARHTPSTWKCCRPSRRIGSFKHSGMAGGLR